MLNPFHKPPPTTYPTMNPNTFDPANTANLGTLNMEVEDLRHQGEEQCRRTAALEKKKPIMAIIASIVATLAIFGSVANIFWVPGPQGPQGLQGNRGDVGPQGPAITNEQLQFVVTAAVEAKLKDQPKAISALEIQRLISESRTPAFNDAALKAETEALRKELAEVRKELAEKPAEAVPTTPVRVGSSGTGWSEEIRETDDIKSNNLGWKVVGGYKFPMAKNKKGLPSPIFGDSEPTWIATGDWKYLDFKLPNGVVVKAWALPK